MSSVKWMGFTTLLKCQQTPHSHACSCKHSVGTNAEAAWTFSYTFSFRKPTLQPPCRTTILCKDGIYSLCIPTFQNHLCWTDSLKCFLLLCALQSQHSYRWGKYGLLFVWIYKFWHITALPQFHLLSQITLHKPQSHWRQLSASVQICSHSHRCNRAQFQNRLFHPARPSHVWIFNSCCSQDVFYR